jgi:hypothetical protein
MSDGLCVTANLDRNVRFGSYADIRHLHMMSALPPKADIDAPIFDVRFVPKADSCTAAKIVFIQSPRRRWQGAIARTAPHQWESDVSPVSGVKARQWRSRYRRRFDPISSIAVCADYF